MLLGPYIYAEACYLPVLGKTVLKTEGTVFSNTDRPRPANNVFIFFSLKNYFMRNICVDFFTEAVSHCARAFDISVKQTRVGYKSI